VIPLPGVRDKGPGPQLGARHPGEQGPYGWYGADEDDHDDGQDDEQQH
jgi:hypothetical protein